MEDTFFLFSPELFHIHLPFLFFFGLIVGSFLNVCIYRIPAGMSIVMPGSHCTVCGHNLKWYENIPVLSYVIQRGMCLRCGTPFSPRYLLVEILTGVTFALVFWVWRYNWATPLYLIFTSMLIIGTFTDIDHWIIPDSMTWGGAIVALVISLPLGLSGDVLATSKMGPFILGDALDHGINFLSSTVDGTSEAIFLIGTDIAFDPRLIKFVPFLNAFIGALFGFGMLYSVGLIGRILLRKEAMGMGDMKLFAFIGAVLGWINCLWVIFIASMLGLIFEFSMFAARSLVGEKQVVPEDEIKPESQTDASESNDEATTQDFDLDEQTVPDETSGEDKIIEGILAGDIPTSRQYSPLPFGPYIAAAAFITLILHDRIYAMVDHFLYGAW